MHLSGLSVSSESSAWVEDADIRREALKVLVNALHGTPTTQNEFADLDGLSLAVKKLKASPPSLSHTRM